MPIFSKIAISIGLLFIVIGSILLWERNNPQRLSFHTYNTIQTSSGTNYPIRIKIVALGIDLPVIRAQIKNNNWETTKNGVSYLSSSPIPGAKGNSILYGHNWENLLGKLDSASPGEIIEITYANGKKAQFVINLIGIVDPTQIHVLSATNDVRLTLYTCAGFLDSKRLVVTATRHTYKNLPKLTEI